MSEKTKTLPKTAAQRHNQRLRGGESHNEAPPLPYGAGDDVLVPFAVESLGARGRAVKLGAELNTLLERHHYPEPVALLAAEAVVLAALLGSALKFSGKFIMQTQTDGAVPVLVCDYQAPQGKNTAGSLRAYARYDAEKLAQLRAKRGRIKQAELLGKGTLAFTIDQGAGGQRYQGIVPLDFMTLEEAAQRYFAQSEQLPTKIRLSSAVLSRRGADGSLREEQRAGGILVQYLPQNSMMQAEAQSAGGQSAEDKWREAEILAASAEDAELTEPQLPVERLLYRLFHSRGVRVFAPQAVAAQCSCSREKLFAILASFSEDARQDSVENGKIHAKCQFCAAEYTFAPEEFRQAAKAAKDAGARP